MTPTAGERLRFAFLWPTRQSSGRRAGTADFCAILQEHKILAVPGQGFGAPGYFLLAFCVADDVITRSAGAFQKAIAQARKK